MNETKISIFRDPKFHCRNLRQTTNRQNIWYVRRWQVVCRRIQYEQQLVYLCAVANCLYHKVRHFALEEQSVNSSEQLSLLQMIENLLSFVANTQREESKIPKTHLIKSPPKEIKEQILNTRVKMHFREYHRC